ncbi:hypothetical protein HCN44_004882 [Aphidius gifuensis]|uniref:Uncharacterized protein n=1 Tax=Aphidius gifuensis TaxID=684658 RepID=A0A835CSR8_APHGI|nr:hypothetical protein HCN44_004882 [Aphidius gifuensis]
MLFSEKVQINWDDYQTHVFIRAQYTSIYQQLLLSHDRTAVEWVHRDLVGMIEELESRLSTLHCIRLTIFNTTIIHLTTILSKLRTLHHSFPSYDAVSGGSIEPGHPTNINSRDNSASGSNRNINLNNSASQASIE